MGSAVIAETEPYPSPVSVGDREILRDGKAQFHVGRALKGRPVHHFFFPVARSNRAADATFLGAAQAGVEVTYIAQVFRDLSVAPRSQTRRSRGIAAALFAIS